MTRIPGKSNRPQASVQRGIEAGTPEKLGHVQRMPEGPGHHGSKTSSHRASGSSSGHRRRRRRRHRRAPKRSDSGVLRRWLLLALGLGGATFAALLIWSLTTQSEAVDPVRRQAEAREADRGQTVDPPDSETALALAESLTSATAPDDFAANLRPGPYTPDAAFAFVEDLRRRNGEFVQNAWSGSHNSAMVPIESVVAIHANGSRRLVALTPAPDGTWRIDFEAFAVHCDPPFPDFPEKPVEAGLARVLAVRYTYYNQRYRDDSEWACFALRNPNSETLIYGYCRRDSDTLDRIEVVENTVLQNTQSLVADRETGGHRGRPGSQPIRLTLQLTKLENSDSRQYHIDRLISDDWVVPEDPTGTGPVVVE